MQLASPGTTVALVLPAKVATVVAEVTITSRWIVASAVKNVTSEMLSWVVSSSGCSSGLLLVFGGFVITTCSVSGVCPVMVSMMSAISSRSWLCGRIRCGPNLQQSAWSR